jgi:hypothetical protein
MKEVFMKNKINFYSVLILVVMLNSCASYSGYIYDDSIPEEECAVIYFANCTPIVYNGIQFADKKNVFLMKPSDSLVQVPAGQITFSCYANGGADNGFVYYTGGNWYLLKLRADNIEFSYAFEPGYYVCRIAYNIESDEINKTWDRKKLRFFMEIYDDIDLKKMSFYGHPVRKATAKPIASIPLKIILRRCVIIT